MSNPPPAYTLAGANMHDGRLIKVMDLGRETPLPLHGRNFRFGIFEEAKDGTLKHVEGGIMANSKRDIRAEFEIYCREQSGLKVA